MQGDDTSTQPDHVDGGTSTQPDDVPNAAKSEPSGAQRAGLRAALVYTEAKVKEYTQQRIKVEVDHIPADWTDWMRTTGCNSLCVDDTWTFLEQTSYNQRRLEAWDERKIDSIVMSVRTEPAEFNNWRVCEVEWEEGSTSMRIIWYPRAAEIQSPDMCMTHGGHKRWWNLCDAIVFGLRIYQLPGKCLYKSDWLDNFEDVDPDAFFLDGKTAYRRWLQFRHWVIVFFPRAMPGWNYHWVTHPPPQENGQPFSLKSVLDMPSLPPDVKLPKVALPEVPDMILPEGATPLLPPGPLSSSTQPTGEAGAPSQPAEGVVDDGAAPPTDAAGEAAAAPQPGLTYRKTRPRDPYCPHGIIEVKGLHAVAKGNKLCLSGATVHHFWEMEGKIFVKTKTDQVFDLKCVNKEQADSWVQSLLASGVKHDETSACCSVA
jgi:hypothetical protein